MSAGLFMRRASGPPCAALVTHSRGWMESFSLAALVRPSLALDSRSLGVVRGGIVPKVAMASRHRPSLRSGASAGYRQIATNYRPSLASFVLVIDS